MDNDEPIDVQAPAPDHILDLHRRVATIIRKKYFIHTTNERLAFATAMEVLEEVTRTYESIVQGAEADEAPIH
jgi:membrane-bound lytic murein transglycosylase MltF